MDSKMKRNSVQSKVHGASSVKVKQDGKSLRFLIDMKKNPKPQVIRVEGNKKRLEHNLSTQNSTKRLRLKFWSLYVIILQDIFNNFLGNDGTLCIQFKMDSQILQSTILFQEENATNLPQSQLCLPFPTRKTRSKYWFPIMNSVSEFNEVFRPMFKVCRNAWTEGLYHPRRNRIPHSHWRIRIPFALCNDVL